MDIQEKKKLIERAMAGEIDVSVTLRENVTQGTVDKIMAIIYSEVELYNSEYEAIESKLRNMITY